ncbi:MAG: lysophospholipid acyltransferase family protein [Gammaproteobacteria bacterium]|nr:lysophospholipid acyltransferase family protein [Gammaproteobacteria bacterium]
MSSQILGLKISTSGKCIKQPALLVANHISWLDIVVIGSQCPTAFLSKSEVGNWPLIGYLAKTSGTLFVKRDSKKNVRETREKIESTISDGRSVVVFPEGTTTNGQSIKPFKSSFYQSAIESGVAVQAIALNYPTTDDGSLSHAPFIDDDAFFTHLIKVLKEPKTEVKAIFCCPLRNRQQYSRKDLADITYQQINSVNNWSLALS